MFKNQIIIDCGGDAKKHSVKRRAAANIGNNLFLPTIKTYQIPIIKKLTVRIRYFGKHIMMQLEEYLSTTPTHS